MKLSKMTKFILFIFFGGVILTLLGIIPSETFYIYLVMLLTFSAGVIAFKILNFCRHLILELVHDNRSSVEKSVSVPLSGIEPTIYYYKSLTSFNVNATNTSTGEMGSIYMPPMSGGRVHGGVAYLDSRTLDSRRMARDTYKERDYETRKSVDVPGYEDVRGKYIDYGGSRHYLWHRTHVLPYNFSLSEGDNIRGLMFAGTAHLNHGDRPQIKYAIDDNRSRVNMLFDKWRSPKYGGVNHLVLTGPYKICADGAPNGTHYSMDDFEQLASRIIRYVGDKKTPFKYAVRCVYVKNELIPKSVEIRLYNLSTESLVLVVRLPNVL